MEGAPTAARDAEPARRELGFRAADGVRLHAVAWGDPLGRKRVLLHGGGAGAHWWDHLATALCGDQCAVALDFRGHGESEHPEALVPGAFGDDLVALLAHLGEPEAALVGHSLGAHVAMEHAASGAPTRALVLLDPSRGAGGSARRAARLALLLRRTYASEAQAIERYRFAPSADAADEALRIAIARRSVRREPDGRYGFNFDPRWFALPRVERPPPSQIRCPVLIVRGAESPLLTAEGARALRDEIPDARLVEIANAGHHVQIDQPAAVADAAARFLDEVGG